MRRNSTGSGLSQRVKPSDKHGFRGKSESDHPAGDFETDLKDLGTGDVHVRIDGAPGMVEKLLSLWALP